MIRLIIIGLFLMPITANSYNPAPTPIKVGQPPHTQPNNIKAQSPNLQRGSKNSPIFIETLERQVDRDEKVDERKYRETETTINKRLVFFTGLMLLVAVGQAILFFYQLNLMRKSVIDTEKAAAAAKKSADVAERTVEIMSDTAQRQLRAYVFPRTDENMSYASDWYRSVPLMIKNLGQTPAYGLGCSLYRAL